jgi:glyoxylase-like metal-dependent hydrolase (beta-lactamase superfamily II)
VTYTGDVVVGGPPQVREAGGLRITKVATPPFDNNCYLLRCTATGDTLLVDAAGDARTLLSLVGDGRLVAVVETHSHWDHVQALAEVRTATGARVLAHPADADELPVRADRLVGDGDVVAVGELAVEVVHLQGHTPGSIALVLREDGQTHLFSGDSLFPGGPGNTDKDPGRFAQLMGDLETKVFGVLPDDTWVYPGHGRDTTLGAERPAIPEWRARGW